MIFRTKIRLEQKISKKIKFIILQLLKVDFFFFLKNNEIMAPCVFAT